MNITCKCGTRLWHECPGAWEPGCDLGANEAHAKLHEPQEPVAWINAARDVLTSHPESWGREDEDWQALYTHPTPQRQPLTDEQIIGLVRDMSIEMRWPSTPLDIARAIERAHGITGETK